MASAYGSSGGQVRTLVPNRKLYQRILRNSDAAQWENWDIERVAKNSNQWQLELASTAWLPKLRDRLLDAARTVIKQLLIGTRAFNYDGHVFKHFFFKLSSYGFFPNFRIELSPRQNTNRWDKSGKSRRQKRPVTVLADVNTMIALSNGI